MRILPNLYPKIPKNRRQHIKQCMREFNKNFSNPPHLLFPVYRNKVGIPVHFYLLIDCIDTIFKNITNLNYSGLITMGILAKLNIDLIPYVNNINKRKAVAFSQYMKKHDITDENELIYGTKKYLINAGSYHYPFLHPQKIKQIAIDEKYTRSLETGILALRTDHKGLINRLLKYLIGRENKKQARGQNEIKYRDKS